MTHSEATEKPVARARGGMARDRATRMPGPRTASAAEIGAVEDHGDHDVRRQREPDRQRPRWRRRRVPRNWIRPAHVAEELARDDAGAEDQPDELERLGDRCGDAAGTLVEAELLVVEERGEDARTRSARWRGTAGSTRAASACRPSARSASSRRTTACSPRSPTTSSLAPVASRSQRPRTGSTSLKARTAKITVGTTNTRNGTRQPNEKASSPAASGPTNAADGVGRAVRAEDAAARLDRVVVGEQRVVRRVDDRLADRAAAAGDRRAARRRWPGRSSR